MAADRRLVRLSKLMSLLLRHRPAEHGLVLDPEGFTPLDELLEVLGRELPGTTRNDVEAVVATVEADKQRFTIADGAIRANYGHSLAGRIAQEAATPPDVLFHGTNEAALATILADGLRPMRRQYVHLTTDRAIARRVGARRGRVRLLEVDAGAAHREGLAFYRANDSFWLVDAVAARFLRLAAEEA